ncbi:MAG TPA: hypothetical protein VK765_04975 [Solirubrobacteraceae bacterium]|jgi:hypothetical protein|nr:hypothetical protein [Solirubrobacteraceae bacterium]
MSRDIINSELARQRQADLHRSAQQQLAWRHAPRPNPPAARHEAVTIRLAAPDDGRELELLARAHGAEVSAGPRLIAELGGRPVATMLLRDRAVIADPGERTTDVVELLRVRAAQLQGDARLRAVLQSSLARSIRSLAPRRRNPDPA